MKNMSIQLEMSGSEGGMASCETCGREIKNHGGGCGGVRCANYCGDEPLRAVNSKRGGARKGTGPKPGKHGTKIDRNTALTADVWAFHASNDESPGRSIEAMTRRSGAFKTWLKSQRGK